MNMLLDLLSLLHSEGFLFLDAVTDSFKCSCVGESVLGAAFQFVCFVWVKERATVWEVIGGKDTARCV